jgi:hypothetical protein
MSTRQPSHPMWRAALALGAASLLAAVACQRPRPTTGSSARDMAALPTDFVQYRWVRPSAPADPRSLTPPSLGDTVALDLAGMDSAWVSSRRHGVDSTFTVIVSLTPRGAAAFGAATATHVGQRIAVLLDSQIVAVATVNSALGARVALVSDVPRLVADSLARRVNRAVAALRPYQPVFFDRGHARAIRTPPSN